MPRADGFRFLRIPCRRSFVHEKPVRVAAFICLLALASVSVQSIRWYGDLGWLLGELVHRTESMPDFILAEGRLEFDGDMPFVLGSRDFGAVIDTTGGSGPDALEEYRTGFLLTADGMRIQILHGWSIPVSWSSLPWRVDRRIAIDGLEHSFWWLYTLGVLALLAAAAAAKSVTAACLGGLVRLAKGRTCAFYESFAAVLRCLLIPVLVSTAVEIALPYRPYSACVYWGLALLAAALAAFAPPAASGGAEEEPGGKP